MENKLKYLGELMETLNSEKLKEISLDIHVDKMMNEISNEIGIFQNRLDDNYRSTINDHIGIIYNIIMIGDDFNKLKCKYDIIKKIISKYYKGSINNKNILTKGHEKIDIIQNKKKYDTIWLFKDGKITLSMLSNVSDGNLMITLTYHHFNYYSIIVNEDLQRMIERQNIYRI